MKLLMCLVVCSLQSSAFSSPVDNSFDNNSEIKSFTGENVTSFEQRLSFVEQKTSLLIGKAYKFS